MPDLTDWKGKRGRGKHHKHFNGPEFEYRTWPSSEITCNGFAYGILGGMFEAMQATLNAGRHYLYMDNPYWVAMRQEALRFAWDTFWYLSNGPDRDADVSRVGCEVKDWRQNGTDILIAPLSPIWHKTVYGDDSGNWCIRVHQELRRYTDRPVRQSDKHIFQYNTNAQRIDVMEKKFENVWCVVTSGSTIEVEAISRGIPVICTRPSAAHTVAGMDLSKIEDPWRGDRESWLRNLAARTFTVKEMQSGKAWSVMKEDLEWMEENGTCLRFA